VQNPSNLPQILGAALPDSSNFFMQFIAMRALFLIWLRMCVPHGGVWQNWCRVVWCNPWWCATCNTGESHLCFVFLSRFAINFPSTTNSYCRRPPPNASCCFEHISISGHPSFALLLPLR
jgi:hypothetical protein